MVTSAAVRLLPRLLVFLGALIVAYVTVTSHAFANTSAGLALSAAALAAAAAAVALAVLGPRRPRWTGAGLLAIGLLGIIAWPYAIPGMLFILAGLAAIAGSRRPRPLRFDSNR